ncbi:MAG: class I SAM-dependent methyltransferase, partial [Burkholderiales bacterium]|nr:class I SAM-dependent methyltransferase [Burkholderiales bacterium]
CWLALSLLLRAGLSTTDALAASTLLGVFLSLQGGSWWRRLLIGFGFPLSLLLAGGLTLPAWGWLLPLALLALIYPLNAWRDAPLFPTPVNALNELPGVAPLEPGARVLDAGCGLGHGLDALRQAYPLAELHGIEWSWPLLWLCAHRCPWAQVERGDIWKADWSGYDLVYLFQRPESMPRAIEKAKAELKPGAWLVSLEFEALGLTAVAKLEGTQGKPVWVYRTFV